MGDLIANGSKTNPQAGDVIIASASALPYGKYRVTVLTHIGGTVTSVDANNVQLQVGSGTVGVLIMSSITGTVVANSPVDVDVPPGGGTISVNATGNGSGTAAVYRGQMVIKPLATYK